MPSYMVETGNGPSGPEEKKSVSWNHLLTRLSVNRAVLAREVLGQDLFDLEEDPANGKRILISESDIKNLEEIIEELNLRKKGR